jgi:hypothetical protein
MNTKRRKLVLGLGLGLGLGCGAAAAAIAAAIVLVAGSASAAPPTRAEYLARVAAVCRIYGPKLDKVPPPGDIGIPGEVLTAVEKALPILEAQRNAVNALRSPTELEKQIAQWKRLDDRSLGHLEEALRAARVPDLSTMGVAYVEFLKDGLSAEKIGKKIGFPHPPC